MVMNRYLKFSVIALLLNTSGIASSQVNDGLKSSKNGTSLYEFNAICSGMAKDFATQKEEAVKFAISAFREKGIATVVIDRLGRNSNWTIVENEKSNSSDTQVGASVSFTDYVLNWSRTVRSKSYGDSEWVGRVTKGTGAISMKFESRLDGKTLGGTYFTGLCEKR
jgi:hypothetical protein